MMDHIHNVKAVIFGCSGVVLTPEEEAFFLQEKPLGLILFDRNIQNPKQLRQLTDSFRKCVGRADAPILVDQEGGRITRLWPPYWHGLGWNRTYGDWYKEKPKKGINGIRQHAKILAKDLLGVGIDVDCWPCLDVAQSDTHEIMKKRCLSDEPECVSALATAGIQTALSKGLMPIIKHIPGYGRTLVDPHMNLPLVATPLKTLEQTDFKPFQNVQIPVWGMSAHVIYRALDKTLPVTLSDKAIKYIRDNIGFQGFLLCDDISMGALKEYGSVDVLAEKAIQAGCDAVLHCNGNLKEMKKIARRMPCLSEQAIQRLKMAEKLRNG